MTYLRRIFATLAITLAMLALPAAVMAQTGDGPADGFGVEGIEPALIGLFPLVTLISSILLKPGAQDEVKRLLPPIVGLIVAVVYFIVDGWPGLGQEVVVNVMGLLTFSTKLYDPVSALAKLLTGGKSLNAITGPGLIGSAPTIEGD